MVLHSLVGPHCHTSLLTLHLPQRGLAPLPRCIRHAAATRESRTVGSRGHRFPLMVPEARTQVLMMNSQGAPSDPQLLGSLP